MAKHGALATGEDRGHPSALTRHQAMADREDPGVNSVQASSVQPYIDGVFSEAQGP